MKGDFAKSIVVFERNALCWRSRPNLDEQWKKTLVGLPVRPVVSQAGQ